MNFTEFPRFLVIVNTPGFWIGSGGFLGWVCHLAAAYTAYRRAELRLSQARV